MGGNHLLRDTGKELQYHHVGIHLVVELNGTTVIGSEDKFFIVPDIKACLRQIGVIGTSERAEVVGIHLGGAVPSHQQVLHVYRELRNHGTSLGIFIGRDLQGSNQVFLAVCP